MQMTGAQIFTQVLMEENVDVMFGYPGGAVLNLYDALYQCRDKITHIMTAHEQGAAHAADGYARATGKTGVVLATSGPGATNLVTGIATAYMDSIPMVAITGNVSNDLIGKDSFQEVYIAGITMPITKHNFVVRRVEDLAGILHKAFRIAQSGRKGPVLVDIPKDVTAAKTDYVPQPQQPEAEPAALNMAAVQQIAEVINKAERPLVYFGGGVRLSDASEELRAFIQKASCPATFTMMGAGVLGYDEPLNLGLIGMHGNRTTNMAINEADVVIALGTRFSDRVALNPKCFAKQATIIHVDIDASEVNKNILVDYSVLGDAKRVLQALLPLLENHARDEWLQTIRTWQAQDYRPKDNDAKIMPHQAVKAMCDIAGPETVYVTDVGQHQLWATQYIRHIHPRNFLTSGGLGTMGFGYGAALGAQAARPDATVVHITGDGSFHMNMNEACTAVSYHLPVITVIMNNTVLGMVRQWQTSFYGKRYSSTDPQRKTDFVRVGEGFGLKAYHCETLEEFKQAFRQAVQDKEPAWIECMIDKDEKVLPMIPAGGSVDNIIMD